MLLPYQRDRLLSRAIVNVLVERLVATHIRISVPRNICIVAPFMLCHRRVRAQFVH